VNKEDIPEAVIVETPAPEEQQIRRRRHKEDEILEKAE
jgi:hypothetical protein